MEYNAYLEPKYDPFDVDTAPEGANFNRGDDTRSKSKIDGDITIDGVPAGDGRVTL